jgi:hypothetical protein
MKQAFICPTCGTQNEPSERPPTSCLFATKNASCQSCRKTKGELVGIGTAPTFRIRKRALLVRTPHGNDFRTVSA